MTSRIAKRVTQFQDLHVTRPGVAVVFAPNAPADPPDGRPYLVIDNPDDLPAATAAVEAWATLNGIRLNYITWNGTVEKTNPPTHVWHIDSEYVATLVYKSP